MELAWAWTVFCLHLTTAVSPQQNWPQLRFLKFPKQYYPYLMDYPGRTILTPNWPTRCLGRQNYLSHPAVNSFSERREMERAEETPTTPPPRPTPPPFIYRPNPFIKTRTTFEADYADLDQSEPELNYPESLKNTPEWESVEEGGKSYIMIPDKGVISVEAKINLPPGQTAEEHAADNQPFHVRLTTNPPPEKKSVEPVALLDRPRTRSPSLVDQICPPKLGELDFVNGQFVKVRVSNPNSRTVKPQKFKMAMIGHVPVRIKNKEKNVTLPLNLYSVQNIPFTIGAHAMKPQGRSSELSLVPKFYLRVNQEAPNYKPVYNQIDQWGSQLKNSWNTEDLKFLDYNEGIQNSPAPSLNQAAPQIVHSLRPPPKTLMYSKSFESVSPLAVDAAKTIYCRQFETRDKSSIEWNSDKSGMKRHPLPPRISIGTAGGNSHYPPNGIYFPSLK